MGADVGASGTADRSRQGRRVASQTYVVFVFASEEGPRAIVTVFEGVVGVQWVD